MTTTHPMPPPRGAEAHIAGVVVYVAPASIALVCTCIEALSCATIYARTDDGKLVVTLETDSTRRTLDYMDAIRALDGVLDIAMVYQHAEPASALEEEIEQ